MRNRQSLDSFLAIAEGRWGDVYSSNFGGTNLTWARTGAKVLHFLWLRLQGVEVSLPGMANYGPKFDPLPNAVFNGLLVLIIYWFARKAFGQKIAFVATIILALDPYLLSESRILRTEAAYAMFIVLTAVSLALYIRTHRRLYLAWSGFWSAWTIATKISGVLLAPIIGLALLCMVWDMRHVLDTTWQRLKRVVIDMLIWGGAAVACTFAIWPTLWVKPLQTFTDLYHFTIQFGLVGKPNLDFFLAGKIVETLPPWYYLLVLLYKTTPLVWLGLGVLGWALWRSHKEQSEEAEVTWMGFPFPLAGGGMMLLSGALYSIAMSFGEIKMERYMMGPVCTWDVAAAIGLVVVGERAYRYWRGRQRGIRLFWMVVPVLFFVGHGLFTVLNHPYYFSYYNPLVGGGPVAAKLIQVGSGEVLDRAMSYLNHKPDTQKQTVVCGTNLPRCEYVSGGQTILKQETLDAVSSGWIGADYVVTYIFQGQRGDYPPGVINYLETHPGPEYTATFQGIEYAKVYAAPHAEYVAASELTGISILLGYDLSARRLAAGDSLEMKFYWENDGQIDHDMFVQLTDTDHYVWSETTASFSPGFEDLRNVTGAILEGEAELSTSVGMPPGRYYLKMGYKTGEEELIGQFELLSSGDAIQMTLPGTFSPRPNPPHRVNLDIDERLAITGYEITPEPVTPGEPFWVVLYWQALEDVKQDYVVGLRLLDADGAEITYWLGRPVHSSYPTSTWQAGQFVQDPWQLTLPEDTAAAQPRPAPGGTRGNPIPRDGFAAGFGPGAGRYQLEVIIFDAETQREVSRARLSPIRVAQMPHQTQRPVMQFESGAQFGESMTLLGYNLYLDVGKAGGLDFSPDFYWQSRSDLQTAFDLLVTLRSAETGQAVGEWQVPLYSQDSNQPKTSWEAGEVVYTTYRLDMEDIAAEGRYYLDLALLSRLSGKPEPAKLDDAPETDFLRIEDIQDIIVVRTVSE